MAEILKRTEDPRYAASSPLYTFEVRRAAQEVRKLNGADIPLQVLGVRRYQVTVNRLRDAGINTTAEFREAGLQKMIRFRGVGFRGICALADAMRKRGINPGWVNNE